MIWTIRVSDIIVGLIATMFIQNMLFILEMICQKKLLNLMSVKQIYFLMKLMVILFFFPIFFSFLFVAYENTFHNNYIINGEDIKNFLVIGERSFSVNIKSKVITSIFIITYYIWLIGFICTLLVNIVKDMNIINSLKKISEMITEDNRTYQLAHLLMLNMNISREVTIYQNDMITTPFVVGLKKISIFIPKLCLPEKEQELILKHELIHSKKYDYLFKRYLLLITSFYWFNPFLNIFKKNFYNMGEMACDQEVLKNETDSIRYLYACLITQIIDEKLGVISAVGFSNVDAVYLERRIRRIMKREIKLNRVFFMLVCVFLSILCPATSFAAAKSSSYVQDKIVRDINELYSFEEVQHGFELYQSEEQTGYITTKNHLNIQMTKGYNNIDSSIDGKEQLITNSIYISKGGKVKIYLTGDNSQDKYRAGIIINGYTRYVTSSSGKIDHTFNIEESGDYDIFIEGTTSELVHVRGVIDITN